MHSELYGMCAGPPELCRVTRWRLEPHRPAIYYDFVLKLFSRETSSGRFIPEMDGLRFVAIAMVVLFHLNGYLMAKTDFYAHADPGWLGGAARVGFHGVDLFFIISGFILALPFAAHHLAGAPPVSLKKYYLRRLTRLEPPYFVTIFLLLGLSTLMHRRAAIPIYPHLLASLAYVHNIIYGRPSSVMSVAWSLEIEIQFYLLVPILTLIFAIRLTAWRRALLIALIFTILALQTWFMPPSSRGQLSILGYLQFFLCGFLLADIFLISWDSSPKHTFFWDVAALALWPALFLALQWPIATHWFFPALAIGVFYAAFRGLWTNRLFNNAWVTAIGGMCYSIYLIHYEVISLAGKFTQPLGKRLPGSLYLALQFAVVGSVIVVVCGIYFIVLEKPCMSRDWPQRIWKAFSPRRLRTQTEPSTTFAD